MLKENHLALFRTHGVLVARILMGGMFFLAGISKFIDTTGTAGYMASAGLPESALLASLVGLFEVVAGLAVIFGKKMAESALLLAIFVLVVNFTIHEPKLWSEIPMQKMLFMKNLGIIAGLLFMVAHSKK